MIQKQKMMKRIKKMKTLLVISWVGTKYPHQKTLDSSREARPPYLLKLTLDTQAARTLRRTVQMIAVRVVITRKIAVQTVAAVVTAAAIASVVLVAVALKLKMPTPLNPLLRART